MNGTPWAGCGAATTDSDPSPPAMPSTSASPAAASAARARKVVARPQDDRLDPLCSRAASTSSGLLARPPPDFGLMNSTGCREASARGPSRLQVMTPRLTATLRSAPSAWADELDRLDAAVYAAIAPRRRRRTWPLRWISRAANHSRLWLGCSASPPQAAASAPARRGKRPGFHRPHLGRREPGAEAARQPAPARQVAVRPPGHPPGRNAALDVLALGSCRVGLRLRQRCQCSLAAGRGSR